MKFDVPARHEWWLSPLIGATTGLVTGATGVFVIPAVPYLQSLGLEKDELVQALGLSFTVSTVALAAGLLQVDAFQLAAAGISVLALIPALAGMLAGQWVRERISAKTFSTVFFTGLLALGAYLGIPGDPFDPPAEEPPAAAFLPVAPERERRRLAGGASGLRSLKGRPISAPGRAACPCAS